MTIARVRILNEVSAVVLDIADVHTTFLYNKYGIHAPNYFFNPRFKLRQWDGKIRFFHKTGKTFLYLLEEIIPLLVKFGYQIKLEDLRKSQIITPDPIDENLFSHILHPDTEQPTVLRQHQVDAVNALIEPGNGLVIASTGSGKTLMCAALCQIYGKHGIRSLTIVPNRDLIRQTKQTYIHFGLNTGEYSGEEKNLNHQHIVSTWQALKNTPEIIQTFQMVIVDECHGLKGNVLSTILTDHAATIPYRFGFTGTLPKEHSDALAVHTAVGLVRYQVGASVLIDKGILAKLHIDVIRLEENLKPQYDEYLEECIGEPPSYAEFKTEYFPDFAAEKSFLQHNEDRLDWIAEFIEVKRDLKKGNVLCLVDNIPFGRKLASLIDGAIFVNGQDMKKSKDRKQVYDMFADSDNLVVIATVHIAGTGIDIHRIFNLIYVDIGKSFTRVIQAIGRGLRTASDKDRVLVTDITSDFKYSKRHSQTRVKYYKEQQYPYKIHKVKYSEFDFEQ